jgi:DNA-binding NtrC family response regulator
MERSGILLVDDNVELAENISEILTESGFEVSSFYSSKKALEAFLPERYVVALLDIRMPEMDGIELYQKLKERDPGLIAIAITAYADDDRVQAAMAAGVLVVLPKPLNVPRLLTKLSSASSGEVVLVVEDELALAQNIAQILLLQGFSPRIVASCQEARTLIQTLLPSVILVDWGLPDGNGLELLEEFNSSGQLGDNCLSILYSGYEERMVSPGKNLSEQKIVFFSKPLPIEHFLQALTSHARPPALV